MNARWTSRLPSTGRRKALSLRLHAFRLSWRAFRVVRKAVTLPLHVYNEALHADNAKMHACTDPLLACNEPLHACNVLPSTRIRRKLDHEFETQPEMSQVLRVWRSLADLFEDGQKVGQ